MASPAQIIHGLPEFSWRGISAPYATASFSFAFDLAERLYYGVDVAAHDNTGRRSTDFPITLLFYNTLEEGLFPARFTSMLHATRDDKSAGDMIHPILGSLRARVQSCNVTLDAGATAGALMELTFVETREQIDVNDVSFSTASSPEALAAASDESIASLGIAYPRSVQAQQQDAAALPVATLSNSTSFFDAYNAVKGNLFSVTMTLTGALNQLIGKVELVLSEITALDDPEATLQRYNLLQFWFSLKRMQRNAERLVARATAQHIVVNPTTMDAFARDVRNSLNDIMSLNVQLVQAPVIPKGAVLKYYTGLAVKFPSAA